MKYYAIHVFTNTEDDFMNRVKPNLRSIRLYAPKRLLAVRKMGKEKKSLRPVFPGYVFAGVGGDILDELEDFWTIRHTPGFIRYLRENRSPSPLVDRDVSLLRHFMSFGEYADTSKVTFDEMDRVVVLEGPLKGLEGNIVKVDRRKGRAKLALDMCAMGFLIDLGFQVIERVVKGGGEVHEDG
jgi:transcriptional antiterminator NusG